MTDSVKNRFPEKLYYTIGDVTKLTGVKPHVLRYWEAQFTFLRPARRYSGHRKFTIREVDLINKIKYLVIDRKYTIAGAAKEINRQINRPTVQAGEQSEAQGLRKALFDIKKEIEDCLDLID